MDEITIGDKTYISSKRAAEITGYAKDYIGQLSREGFVDARKVGRSWYVYEPSIRVHRFGEDAAEGEGEISAEESVENSLEHALEDEREAIVETESALGTFKNRLDTWKQPMYTAEEPQTIPQTLEKPENGVPTPAYEELLPPAEETLTDMQEAWKEWFERKQEVLETPEIESPEVMEAREHEQEEAAESEEGNQVWEEVEDEEEDDGEGVTIPLHRLDEDEEDEEEQQHYSREEEAETVSIRPIQAPKAAAPVAAVESAPAIAAYAHERPLPQAPEARIVEERVIRRATPAVRKAPVRTRSNAPAVALLIGISLVVIAVAFIGSGFASPYLKTLGVENPILDYLVGTRTINK